MSVRGFDRPLGLGEILDRAVTLSVQRFPMFLAIAAVTLVPTAILSSFAVNPLSQYLSAINATTHGNAGSAGKILASVPASRPFDYLVIALSLFLSPLLYGALSTAVARSVRGESIDVGSTYGSSARRYPSLLMTYVLWFFISVVGIVAFTLVATVITVLLASQSRVGHQPLALSAGPIIVVGVLVLLSIPIFAIGYALANVSFNAVVLESGNPFAAIGSAFARIFARREYLRAIVMSFALLAITIVSALFGALLGGVAFSLTHWFPLYIFLGTTFSALGVIFTNVTATIYYFDVRLRRDGEDLLLQAPDLLVPSA